MSKLWLLILFISMPAYADTWPEGVKGGLEIARIHCLNPDINLNDLMVFEFEEDGEKVFFPISCKDLLKHLSEKEGNDGV